MMIRDFLNTEDDLMGDALETGIFLPRPPVERPQQRPDDCKCDLSCVDTLPVGSMYAPMQVFRKLFAPQQALDRGTLFCELDLPFMGGKQR